MTSRHVYISAITWSGNRPPKWSSNAATISIRSSESSPSSTIDESSSSPTVRSLPIDRTTSNTISGRRFECLPAGLQRGYCSESMGRERPPADAARLPRQAFGLRMSVPDPPAHGAERRGRDRPVAPCPMPLGHHVQASVQERITADVPLDLAAGGLGDTPGAHEHNRVDHELMLPGHVAADRLDHLGRLRPLAPFQLQDDHQLLFGALLHCERGAQAVSHARVALCRRGFYVLWVVVVAADDHQILQPAGDEQLAVVREAQVTGTQERAFARVLQVRAERLLRFVGSLPISLRDTWPRHPDLADLAGRHAGQPVRVGNDNLLVGHGLSATDQGTGSRPRRLRSARRGRPPTTCHRTSGRWVGRSCTRLTPAASPRPSRSRDRRPPAGSRKAQTSQQTARGFLPAPARPR